MDFLFRPEFLTFQDLQTSQIHSFAEIIQERNRKRAIPLCKNLHCHFGKPKFHGREYLGHHHSSNLRKGLGGECESCAHALFWTNSYDELDADQTRDRYDSLIRARKNVKKLSHLQSKKSYALKKEAKIKNKN